MVNRIASYPSLNCFIGNDISKIIVLTDYVNWAIFLYAQLYMII